MADKLFLNSWQKGSSESANIGFGTFVGVETYSHKGVAQLTKDTVKVSGSVVTDLPLYCVIVVSGVAYVQGDTGKVYAVTSVSSIYDTWTDITNSGTSGDGHGLIYFQGYLFAFRGTTIEYYFGGSWTVWKTGITDDVSCPMIFPNDGFVYASNGSRVIKFGFGTAVAFNPAGVSGTDYFYSPNWGGTSQTGLLPSFYQITSMSFLPSNYIALGTSSPYNPAVADLILWNPTLSTYETPLRVYSQAQIGENGIRQLINRNNVLYAITGGSHSIFSTNGTSFQLIADLSLYSNIRKTTGAQAQIPVFMSPRVSAIDVFGNKLLTGVSTPLSITSYPTGYGLFPCGVWTVAFGTENAIQCEYTISTGTTVAVNKQYIIGFLKCVGANQTLIGWKDGSTYGVDLVSNTNYQNDIDAVSVESEMMEVGTPLTPETIQTIQLNMPRQLLPGQTVRFNYRTGFDQDYTPLTTGVFTSANNNDGGYKIVANAIGATRFLQLQMQMASTTDLTYSPELRNIIIAP